MMNFVPAWILIAGLLALHSTAAAEGPLIADRVEFLLRESLDGDGVVDVRLGTAAEIEIVVRITASSRVPGAFTYGHVRLDQSALAGPDEDLELLDHPAGLPIPPWIYVHDCSEWHGSVPVELEYYCMCLGDPDSEPGGVQGIDGTVEVVLERLVIQGSELGTYAVTFELDPTGVFAYTSDFLEYVLCNPCEDPACAGETGVLIIGTGDPTGCSEPLVVNVLPSCEGDVNADGAVDPLDAGFILSRFGCDLDAGDPYCDTADQNDDAVVNPLDVGFVLARFGECP